MKFIDTIKNIWSIKELRGRILFTLLILAIYRLGSFIVLPAVNATKLEGSTGSNEGLLGLLDTFTGGAFNKGSIFALGIMPYITASIIIQLLGFAVPYFQRLQQKEGESGRKKITQITRILTVIITLVQGSGYLAYIQQQGAIAPEVSTSAFWITGLLILSTGTVFAMWLGEKITDKGIGNGISLLIMIGIIASLPVAFSTEIQRQVASSGFLSIIIEVLALFLVIIATILIVQGVRRIPIQFAKRMVGRSAEDLPQAGARDYIPLKVNASGVMPIIFAQAIMFLPATIVGYLAGKENATSEFLMSLSDWKSITYNVIFFLLIVVFTYVYTALLVNPQQYADYLKRQNSFIPGIKPGVDTQNYIDTLTTRITLPGSIFLGLIAVLPAIIAYFGVSDAFAIFFGGTSLLILVGVTIDTLQQVENYLLMKKYDGLVQSGKINGRNSGAAPQIGADF